MKMSKRLESLQSCRSPASLFRETVSTVSSRVSRQDRKCEDMNITTTHHGEVSGHRDRCLEPESNPGSVINHRTSIFCVRLFHIGRVHLPVLLLERFDIKAPYHREQYLDIRYHESGNLSPKPKQCRNCAMFSAGFRIRIDIICID